jgi:protocatechuate 3,4-dioxygenase alpha subunit
MTTRLVPTPAQTAGPFFGTALPFVGGDRLVPLGHPGAVRLHGTVHDGAGAPVSDALLEIWQSDPGGAVPGRPGSLHRDGYTFTGWGRVPTDNAGHYSFTTLQPGPREGGGAPFIAVTVFARGLMHHLFTRAYLPEGEPLVTDPFLSSLPPERRPTLVAVREDDGSLVFDVHLQGEHETVFLAFGPSSSGQS